MTQRNDQQDDRERSSSRRNHELSSTQIVFAVILAIGLMLAINFSSRISDEQDLNQIRGVVEQEIELLRQEQRDLQAQLDYVQSDTYVQDWARREGKMVRDGDVLFVPVPVTTSNETAADPSTPEQAGALADIETTYPEPQSWELWWQLFFDSPPPEM